MGRSWKWFFVGVVVHWSAVPAGSAERSGGPAPTTEKCAIQPAAASAIEVALAKQVPIQFAATPLVKVMDWLGDALKIEVALDRKSLEDAAIDSERPITFQTKSMTVEAALDAMLKPIDLTWTIEKNRLLVTTPETAETLLSVEVCDVADLVVYRDREGRLWDDYEPLLGVITNTLDVPTWDLVGGPGSAKGASLGTAKILVVSQTWRVRRRIAALLKEIREVAAKKSGGPEVPRSDPPEPITPPNRTGTTATTGGGMFALPPSKPEKTAVPDPFDSDVGPTCDAKPATKVKAQDPKPPEEPPQVLKIYDVADLVVCRDSKGCLWDDYDTLSDLITATLEPAKWDAVGGEGHLEGASLGTAKVLVVSQSAVVHRQIDELLRQIREMAGKRRGGEVPRRDMEKKAMPIAHGHIPVVG